MMTREQQQALALVARAALDWNRARLVRIAIAKQVPPWPLPGHREGEAMKRQALSAEAKAKAALRKACMKADPAPVVVDVQVFTSRPLGSMPFRVELDNLKDTDVPIHPPAASPVATD